MLWCRVHRLQCLTMLHLKSIRSIGLLHCACLNQLRSKKYLSSRVVDGAVGCGTGSSARVEQYGSIWYWYMHVRTFTHIQMLAYVNQQMHDVSILCMRKYYMSK